MSICVQLRLSSKQIPKLFVYCSKYHAFSTYLINKQHPGNIFHASSSKYHRCLSLHNKNRNENSTEKMKSSDNAISKKEQLKQAVRDYGATIVIFHISIALTSLGLCYIAISNGMDAAHMLTLIGFSESIVSSKIAVGGSTFVIAYAVHKMFAPIRMGITLTAAPIIVRHLRNKGWLKPTIRK